MNLILRFVICLLAIFITILFLVVVGNIFYHLSDDFKVEPPFDGNSESVMYRKVIRKNKVVIPPTVVSFRSDNQNATALRLIVENCEDMNYEYIDKKTKYYIMNHKTGDLYSYDKREEYIKSAVNMGLRGELIASEYNMYKYLDNRLIYRYCDEF